MARSLSSLTWDYIVFFVFLILSSLVPLWSRIFGKKRDNTKADFVFAVGKISILAMMLSIARGTLGVRAFLGYPSELFYRGSAMWETLYGMVTAYPVVLYVFIPVYYSLGITSVYQYLDLRYNSRLVRCLASISFILRQVLALGVTVYTPSVALNTIIGVPYWMSLVGITVVGILFTVLGGLKAAITADVIQGVTMIAISVAIIIQGIFETGSPKKVYDTVKDEGRFQFFNFSGDFTLRVDTVSAWVGQLFMSLSQFGCQQNFVQRYVSLKTFAEVKKTMLSNIPMIIILFSLSWIVGMGVFSTYVNCDPLAAGYTKKMDEILPFFVEDKFAYLPGFLGLFMATIFNGALSLSVSNINSLATVTWEDFLSPLPHFKGLTEKQEVNTIKFLGCMYSIIVMGVAFSVGLLSGVIESAMLMTSVTSGPLLGVFLLAMIFPMSNWKGAATGMIMSNVVSFWLAFGSFTVKSSQPVLMPTSVDGCTNHTFSQAITKSSSSWLVNNMPLEVGWNSSYAIPTTPPAHDPTILQSFYSISFMYWSIIGTFVTVFVGVVVSWLTASSDDVYDSNLLFKPAFNFSKWLPGKARQYKAMPSKTAPEKCLKVNLPTEKDNLGFEIEEGAELGSHTKRVNGFTTATIEDLNKIDTVNEENLPSMNIVIDKNAKKETGNGLESVQIKSLVVDNKMFSPKPVEIYKRIDENEV
ncbi:sodium-coupled monocarboxylate transporter 1 [Phlebotomus argentipes]|uniref:sodium-coupled monocarboxylate transporter 1 n=1 Tax=Phlebotomus argentipes TaxID=94469 RepID=UPI0028933E04|nr:sodium-coupled monocarboxylate transporter 1 [Phlebotomus argentipes]XP_059611241.1 sodium-coupled monocarboxylate transporter 1 [Phlebotomus argentipes]